MVAQVNVTSVYVSDALSTTDTGVLVGVSSPLQTSFDSGLLTDVQSLVREANKNGSGVE